jgi:hypothetical protein
MSQHIQGGADFTSQNGKKTKTALKAAINIDPGAVHLYATSNMGPQFRGPAADLPDDAEFVVVGPDPYTKRDWYATVKKGVKGNLVVT